MKVDTLTAMLTKQSQQTEQQQENLSQDLEKICFKLDSLTATTTKLSTDLKEMKTSISNIVCTDQEEISQLIQSLQDDVKTLSTMLTEQAQQSEQQFESITQDLVTISSQLNSLTNTTTQLQNHQNAITEQLADIDSNVETLLDQPVFTCGGTGGWRRVVYLDMSDESTTCPNGWELTGLTPRTCGAPVTASPPICHPVSFPVNGGEYNRVCGRIKGYQLGNTLAFLFSIRNEITEIDEAYGYGVSLTHGSPRQHIWTFLSGVKEQPDPTSINCPCASSSPSVAAFRPSFVGEDFFCESGNNDAIIIPNARVFFPNDVLWDGEDCGSLPSCCTAGNPPFLTKQLPSPTTDAIEARICGDATHGTVVVELVELYVQRSS